MHNAADSTPEGFEAQFDTVPRRDSTVDDPDRWVELHGNALFREAFSRVGDRTVAEDLVQETLLSAWRSLEGFDHRSSFRTWLVAILKRRVADHFRKHGRNRHESDCEDLADFDRSGSWAKTPAAWRGGAMRTAVEAAASESSPQQSAEHAELWEVLMRCAGDLPGHLGRVLRSRAFKEKSTDEVCQQEGISQKNLSVRMHRARMLLRRCLEQKWFCPEQQD